MSEAKFSEEDSREVEGDTKEGEDGYRHTFTPKVKELPKLSDDDIIEKMQAFFYEDEALARHFEFFIDEHSSIVDLSSDEYKLAYTEVFHDYRDLFERKMEDFIVNSLKCSVHEVYEVLKRKIDHEAESTGAFFAKVLIAVSDFDIFITMMRESAMKQVSRK